MHSLCLAIVLFSQLLPTHAQSFSFQDLPSGIWHDTGDDDGRKNGDASVTPSIPSTEQVRASSTMAPSTRYSNSMSTRTSTPAITVLPSATLALFLNGPSTAWDVGSNIAEEVYSLSQSANSNSDYSVDETATPDSDIDTTAAGYSACISAVTTFVDCIDASSSAFVTGGADYAWTCLCNDWDTSARTYSWVGPAFDRPYGSCIDYLSSQSYEDWTSFTPMNGFCAKVSASKFVARGTSGPMTPADPPATTTPSAPMTPTPPSTPSDDPPNGTPKNNVFLGSGNKLSEGKLSVSQSQEMPN